MKLPLLPLLLAACFSAQAHTPYLLPTSFEAQPGATVSMDAGFTEKFFLSDVAFGDTRFTLTAPDGSVSPIGDVRQFRTRTVAEQKLPQEKGTYRISTGPRLGAIFRSWERAGKVEVARDPATPVPEGAKLLSHYQSLSVSEAYITAGSPTRAALKASGEGLEIVPVTHPSDLFAGEAFEFLVHYQGQPLADQKVEIFRSPMDMASQHSVERLQTDARGRIAYTPAKPGVYLALVRYRSDAPAGAKAPQYGNNYTLTFRVLAQ
ncbi:DUF4198 domain-containing protein [Comamonas composti]|uniref:DUF4198 domain-containing protein n=1 Tax=Comamonas composti TaxID=408558 RepID=UPI000478AD64|nr:DUF4198 domain-containing protein [Comamonas composti]